LPYLLESEGAVVNVGSIGGLRGKAWQAAYSAAKAGVANLTRALACEYVGRVRFNCVAMGGIGGNITENSGASIPPDGVTMEQFFEEYRRRVIPPVRLGEAHEVAGVVAFLLSDDASFMDGSVVVADGATLA
jgi:meso-butanediol dehydrogenase/(S,S)-butanediol dehydrogenase/diacetyl reductase